MTAINPTPLEISSVEDGVYRALRLEIGRLELAPGERLRLEELAGRFGVSLTPVRHALRRLESEGLVVSLPRRGSRVAPLSVEELEEIQALRLGLETFLARLGAQAVTDAALEEMTQAGATRWSAPSVPAISTPTSPRSGRSATRAIAARRGRGWSGRCRTSACAWSATCSRSVATPRPSPTSGAGPDTLLEACRARDGEAAEAATRDALRWVLAELRRMLENDQASTAEAS